MQAFLSESTQHKIKTFANQSLKAFHKSYKGRLTTYREKQSLWDSIKIGLGGLLFFVFFFIYLYFINLSSTKGYFMKIAQEELNITTAKSDIIKLQIVAEKKENRENLTIPQKSDFKQNYLNIQVPLANQEKQEYSGSF